MKIFGFSRNGFLYIDNGNNLISQQTTSSESQMLNDYSSIWEYKNYDDALATFNHHKPKPTSIDRKFQEDMINDVVWDMTDIDKDWDEIFQS